MKISFEYIIWTLALLLCLTIPTRMEAKDFVVVIDAGHGGHDPGAVGRTAKEKHINLNVALKLGELISRNCPDVKVVYTRRRDVFIALDRRAEIANNAKADLFISIHTNALAKNHTATGASTWTLGLAKSDANLDVAKRENAVILYESDYETRYAGFNPNSAESYIIFEFMQDKYMEQSVHLASLVQKNFRNVCRRADRGVHQAGFLVLKASAMPSILVELGFISTPSEERYLSSETGASNMANGIYRAFLTYKHEQELRHGTSPSTNPEPVETTPSVHPKPIEEAQKVTAPPQKPKPASTPTQSAPVFKLQLLTSQKKLSPTDRQFKGVKDVEWYCENGLYKYTCGASTNYNAVLRTKRQLATKFKDAFIVAFRNQEKMNVKEAIEEFKRKKR